MRKYIFMIFSLLLFILSGCATSIEIERLVPSKFDMSEYRSLAVEPVTPFPLSPLWQSVNYVEDLSESSPVLVYPSYQLFSERLVAQHVDQLLAQELGKNSYFDLFFTRSQQGDLNALYRQGYRGLLSIKVGKMGVKEYIFGRKIDDETTSYHLRQRVELALTYTIVDTKRGNRVYTNTFQHQLERTFDLSDEESSVTFAPSVIPMFEELSSLLVEKIVNSLAPRKVTTLHFLMKNKPKLQEAEEAYSLASKQLYGPAYTQFLDIWQRYTHLPSGYNAALLAESLGRREEALSIMSSLYRDFPTRRVEQQLVRMRRYLEEQSRAESQY